MTGPVHGEGKPILFLCDGGFDLGFGHVSRCLALAEALEERRGISAFAGRLKDGARELVTAAGFEVMDRDLRTGEEEPAAAAALCRAWGAAAAVVDSYALGSNYLRTLAQAIPVFLIDDYGSLAAEDYAYCRAILNPAIVPDASPYPSAATVWSGPCFVPFRRSLRLRRRTQFEFRRTVRRVLVTLGGGDPGNLTQRVVGALARIAPDVAVFAVVGRGYSWKDQLAHSLLACGRGSRMLVQLPTLVEVMDRADLCVCGGGMTKYEAAYWGIPALTIPLNQGQVSECRLFDKLGLVLDLGLGDQLTDARLAQALAQIICDASMREALARQAWQTFSPDEAGDIAAGFYRLLAASE